MSFGKLVVKQAFGVAPSARNCATFFEGGFAYVSGHHVALINTESKDQNFIALGGSHHSYGITAITCNLLKRYMAIAEKSDPHAVVTFYDTHTLRKKKTINYPDIGSKEIKSLSFSEDGKFLIMQGGSPEWNLVLWSVEKNPKLIATVKTTSLDENYINQVSICPWDSGSILVYGKNVFKIYRIIEGQFRPLSTIIRRDQFNALSHAWLADENLIIGTEAGDVLLYQNFEFRANVYPLGGEHENDIIPVLCLVPTSRGFIGGTIDGEVRVFEKQVDAREHFQLESKFYIAGKHCKVVSMAVGTDDTLVVITDTNQMLSVSVSNLYNAKETAPTFENVLTSFHGPNARGECAITGIDVALWRPMVVTCGKDCTVRLWNPADRKIEFIKKYDDEPHSVTFHPSGLYLSIAFSDKIKIISILQDQFSLAHDISVRACTYVKFSKGGHYVAAICGSSIQIFNTFTGTLVCSLRGHANKIRSIAWMNYDSRMMSTGADGVVYFWDLFPLPVKRPETFNSPVPFHSGATTLDGSRAFVSTTDRQLKEIYFTKSIDPLTGLEGSIKDPRDVPIGFVCNFSVMDDVKKILILASSDDEQPGSIITLLTTPQLSTNFEANPTHAGPITALCLSQDGNTIYTGDANGCLCVSEYESHVFATNASLNKIQGVKAREGIASFDFVDEVVIKKSELESKKSLIVEYTARVEELTLNNEHQLRLKEMDHADKIKEISVKFSYQLTAERDKLDELLREKQEMEKSLKMKMKVLKQAQAYEVRDIDTKYKTKISAESNRHKNLLMEIEDIHKRWNEDNRALVESHQLYLRELTEDYESKLHEEQSLQKSLLEEKEFTQAVHDENRVLTEKDGDIEIVQMKMKYETRLKNEQDLGVELMAQHALLKKNLQLLTKDTDQQKEDIKKIKEKEFRLNETIKSLEKDIQSHKKEIREREETITDKEKRIFDLKKKNQELEKFRFVLDYKIKELKLQIAPRESEIATMKKQIEDMGLELEQYHKSNLALNLMIEELKLKLDGLRREYDSQVERIEVSTTLMDKIKRDLQDLSDCIDIPSSLKSKTVKIYQLYVQEDIDQAMDSIKSSTSQTAKPKNSGTVDPQEAYNRDREQTERSLDALRRAIKTDTVAHKRDFAKMVRENVVLTKELNTLRKDARKMTLQMKAIEYGNAKADYDDVLSVLEIPQKQIFTSQKPDRPPGSGGGNDESYLKASKTKGSSGGRTVSRSAALRTTSAEGRVSSAVTRGGISKIDNYQAWREIQMQYDQMMLLEDHLSTLCQSLGINPLSLLAGIDSAI